MAEKKELELWESETGSADAGNGQELNNMRANRLLKLQEKARKQNEMELQRGRRLQQEQLYIDRMLESVEESLENTAQEKEFNDFYQKQLSEQVYRLHGVSRDKRDGMEWSRQSWYRGMCFSMFFLSAALFVLCGVLHGFDAKLTLFVGFITALEGALFRNEKRKPLVLEGLFRVLYFLLFPVCVAAFVMYELAYPYYDLVMAYSAIIAIVLLILGVLPYFFRNPYRSDKKRLRTARKYMQEMEKAAAKELKAVDRRTAKELKKQEKRSGRQNTETQPESQWEFTIAKSDEGKQEETLSWDLGEEMSGGDSVEKVTYNETVDPSGSVEETQAGEQTGTKDTSQDKNTGGFWQRIKGGRKDRVRKEQAGTETETAAAGNTATGTGDGGQDQPASKESASSDAPAEAEGSEEASDATGQTGHTMEGQKSTEELFQEVEAYARQEEQKQLYA